MDDHRLVRVVDQRVRSDAHCAHMPQVGHHLHCRRVEPCRRELARKRQEIPSAGLRQRMAQGSVSPGCAVRTLRRRRDRFRVVRLEEHQLQKMILLSGVGRRRRVAHRTAASVLISFVHAGLCSNFDESPIN